MVELSKEEILKQGQEASTHVRKEVLFPDVCTAQKKKRKVVANTLEARQILSGVVAEGAIEDLKKG